MGRQSLLADKPSTPIKMKVLLLLALAARQITGQDDGHGGMGGSGMEGSGSGYGMGGYGYGMGGSGYGGEWSEWMSTGGYGGGECCPTKKIWGSMNPEKDGFYDLVVDEYMMQNMMENGYGTGSGYGMGSGSGMGSGEGMNSRYGWSSWNSWYYSYGYYWRRSGHMGSGDGYGMGSGMGGGSGYGMGMGYGGMGSDMDDGEWPERCRSFCIYKKRDSYDDRSYCFARSSNSQSMCMRDDGEKPINV